jgi:carboxypeptidase Q
MFETPLARVDGGDWECRLDLPPGRYVYKFIVDGEWTSDPATPADQLIKDGKGHGGLTALVVE